MITSQMTDKNRVEQKFKKMNPTLQIQMRIKITKKKTYIIRSLLRKSI